MFQTKEKIFHRRYENGVDVAYILKYLTIYDANMISGLHYYSQAKIV